MRQLFSKVIGGEFAGLFRGMGTLFVGSGGATLIGFAVTPILTRLYAPADFGVMAVYTSLVLMLAPLMTLRYALALPLPRHDRVAINLFTLAVGLMIVSGGIVGIFLWLFALPLFRAMSLETLTPWWSLVVLGLLGTCTYELLTSWATRKRSYKLIAQTKITQSLTGNLVKLGFGILAPGAVGLIIGQLVSQSGGISTMSRAFVQDFRVNRRQIRWSRVKRVAIAYKGFPIFRFPAQILSVISQQSPLLLMSMFYGISQAGQLALTLTVLALPINLVGASMGKALYAEAATLGIRQSAKILRMVKSTQLRLFVVGLFPVGVLLFFGPELFVRVFGDKWAQAGQFSSILSIYLLFQFTSAPLIQVVNLLNEQHVFLAITASRALAVVFLFLGISYFGYDELFMIKSYSSVMTVFYFLTSLWVIHRLKAFAKRINGAG